MDAETAFYMVTPKNKEEVYMGCPEGMVVIEEVEALLLQSTI